ncbi:ABC transporter substrate-binding protein [Paracoccus sp. M683]|uniref:ABC transporter substrate-binding protein n=1 Tax=Paracoccus sp. M683 TaxID=2594268 RepID=UPI00117E644C|nr:ABC transporter substrate-binding protein [Paracoccus sp. M683]TRW99187.1 ABC transporter substrate-binding protein [Paracoccus sp. M683]
MPPITLNRRLFLTLTGTGLAMPSILRASSGWPREVAHALGTSTIAAAPQRIVSIGFHEQDFLYALGLAPVGVHEWFGGHPFATWIWAEETRQTLNATPEVQNGFEVDIEWVYAQQPDLIVASFFNLSASDYQLLSGIAPVIGPPEGFPVWSAPWQAELRLIAQATGAETQADAAIAAVDQRIAMLAAENPEFAGKSATIGFYTDDHFVGYRSDAGANLLLKKLGLQTPPEFDALVQPNGQFSVSPERIDLFDLDAVLWLVDPDTAQRIQDMPVYQQTRLAREGRSVWADPELTGALSFMSPLSIPYALDRLAPVLRTALGQGA